MRARLLCLVLGATVLLTAPADAVAPMPPDKRIVAKVSSRLAGPDDAPLVMPTDVASDSRGRVYVADGVNNRVLIFDAAGKPAGLLTTARDTPLKCPTGLFVDATDRLWIADTGNRRVVVVAPTGELADVIPVAGADAAHPTDATDVAVSADGTRLFVIDNDNHRILIRDNATGKWTAAGKSGQALGQFRWPFTACIDGDGELLVCEAIGARVQRVVPGPEPRWAGEIGHFGVRLGQLYRPKGVASVGRGDATRVYVSDSTTGTVQAFDLQGRSQGALTDDQGRLLRFEHPMGLWIDRQGRLLIVEFGANRVAVVDLPDSRPAPDAPTTQPDAEGRP
ncbi:MAG: hypothetical protein BIFFINMI_03159 [Phycisphaerae bacterium]|nr:hypothetical protein [Phycisphaerae bacterium]